ncbi:hypothetical protein AB4874_19265 [Thioclava sp. 15-R06ZXC-3]|uniref:Uncharacterized protein n=1 Tax=Thioclava arctica TaxID=3238301 RepID=A0ABV3TR17_9RHOB
MIGKLVEKRACAPRRVEHMSGHPVCEMRDDLGRQIRGRHY